MKILILYDAAATDDRGVNWLSLWLAQMAPAHSVETVLLDHKEIMPCIGCFGCWVKTPGLCVLTGDQGNERTAAYVRADKVILLSKVTYGGYSPDIKAFLDRSLAMLSPFFTVHHGKMHHRKRYDRYPDLLAFGYGDMTETERHTFMALFNRNALNLYPRKHMALTAKDANEMNAAAQDIAAFLVEG